MQSKFHKTIISRAIANIILVVSREGCEPRPSQSWRPSLTTDAYALHTRMGGLNLNVNLYGNSHVGRSIASHDPGVFAESPLPPPCPTQLEITKQRTAAAEARLAQLYMEEAEYNRKRQEWQLASEERQLASEERQLEEQLAQLYMEEAEYNRKRQERQLASEKRQLEEQRAAAEAQWANRENVSVRQP